MRPCRAARKFFVQIRSLFFINRFLIFQKLINFNTRIYINRSRAIFPNRSQSAFPAMFADRKATKMLVFFLILFNNYLDKIRSRPRIIDDHPFNALQNLVEKKWILDASKVGFAENKKSSFCM
jgi:hypothetical protein